MNLTQVNELIEKAINYCNLSVTPTTCRSRFVFDKFINYHGNNFIIINKLDEYNKNRLRYVFILKENKDSIPDIKHLLTIDEDFYSIDFLYAGIDKALYNLNNNFRDHGSAMNEYLNKFSNALRYAKKEVIDKLLYIDSFVNYYNLYMSSSGIWYLLIAERDKRWYYQINNIHVFRMNDKHKMIRLDYVGVMDQDMIDHINSGTTEIHSLDDLFDSVAKKANLGPVINTSDTDRLDEYMAKIKFIIESLPQIESNTNIHLNLNEDNILIFERFRKNQNTNEWYLISRAYDTECGFVDRLYYEFLVTDSELKFILK